MKHSLKSQKHWIIGSKLVILTDTVHSGVRGFNVINQWFVVIQIRYVFIHTHIRSCVINIAENGSAIDTEIG